MKITNNDLKKIIKESLKRLSLQEAPFAGIEPMMLQRKDTDQSYENWADDTQGMNANPKSIDKFYRTPSYEKKANWAFAGYSIPIYIIPHVGTSQFLGLYLDNPRLQFFSRETFEEIVNESDVEIDVQKVFSNLDNGACYIISSSDYLSRGGLPTPWMIFHAMFDAQQNQFVDEDGSMDWETFDVNGNYPKDLRKIYEIGLKIESLLLQKYGIMGIGQEAQKRTNLKNVDERTSSNDIVAELITQELATSSGLLIKEVGDSDDKLWKNIQKKLKLANLKKVMEKAIQGQIIMVANTVDG